MKVQFHNVTFLRLRVLIELEMWIYCSCVWILFFDAPTSALFCFSQSHILGLSGAGNRVELGCAPLWEGRGERRPKAPTILCQCQSAAPGERTTKGRHGPLPSISHPDCVPFWCCPQGRSLCLLGLPHPQNNWLSQHVLTGTDFSSPGHTNSLFCCC